MDDHLGQALSLASNALDFAHFVTQNLRVEKFGGQKVWGVRSLISNLGSKIKDLTPDFECESIYNLPLFPLSLARSQKRICQTIVAR